MARSNEGIGKGNSSVIVWIYSRLQSIEKKNSGLGKCLTISVIVFNMASRHLLNMENKGYSGALGTFLMGGNGNFTGYLDASNSVAVNLEQLQNTPQLIYMSLNKNSVYCVMPRSSKPPDTCK